MRKSDTYYIYDWWYNLEKTFNTSYEAAEYIGVSESILKSKLNKRVLLANHYMVKTSLVKFNKVNDQTPFVTYIQSLKEFIVEITKKNSKERNSNYKNNLTEIIKNLQAEYSKYSASTNPQ